MSAETTICAQCRRIVGPTGDVHLHYDATTQSIRTLHRECWVASQAAPSGAAFEDDIAPAAWVDRG